jgi:hypothetical protein
LADQRAALFLIVGKLPKYALQNAHIPSAAEYTYATKMHKCSGKNTHLISNPIAVSKHQRIGKY